MVQAAEPLSTRSRNCRGFDGVGERQFSSFKQELLTTDLQLSDLKLKLNDLMDLPVTTGLELDPTVPEFQEACLLARRMC